MGTILGTVAAMIVGGAVAAVTVVGVVSSQTSPQGDSPANVNAPVVQYGATQ
ncbi:hypothetical protein GCM10027270_22300 [Nocardioides ginkgobilobae]|uniref:Unannotated protein n=1 Tax=freshwater metagenome TaxID=449393 RepID=A0A6J6T3W1_9ZZZZ|nr:hypothetical protein [Nocardioides sp.]MSY84363.1 hypothetical protein [Actinomycetota bacterium]